MSGLRPTAATARRGAPTCRPEPFGVAPISALPAKQYRALLRALHREAARWQMSHDQLHTLARIRYGQDSLTKLTKAQAEQLIGELSRQPERPENIGGTAGRRDRLVPDGAVTGVEIAKIEALCAALGWSQDRLRDFITGQIGSTDLRTAAHANKVLWGMKAILRRGTARRALTQP